MNMAIDNFSERRTDSQSNIDSQSTESLEKYTVLAIDDDIAITNAFKRGFRKDFNILTAGSVLEALKILVENPSVDLILTDYHMPGLNGAQGVSVIRETLGHSNTPIVMVTGENSHASQNEAFESGVIDFVSKPILFPSLAQKIKNICNERQIKKQLEDLAFKDALTGLFNRRSLMPYLERELNRCKRLGHHCSVVTLDIDHFKSINDNYGHDVGDQALKLVSKTFTHFFQRTVDYVSRLGGEEFVLVLSNAESLTAQEQLQECRNAIKKIRLVVNGEEVDRVISLSAGGITVAPTSNIRDHEILLKASDNLLFQAKKTRDAQVWDNFLGN